jgi:two-component SAPR family response regulator
VIWPEVEVSNADSAFHRTLNAVRQVLGAGPSDERGPVEFGGGRYRLRAGLIDWSDVAAFEDAVARGLRIAPSPDAIPPLEGARLLYRADYMDDVPFFGASEYAEGRRSGLRHRLADALAALAASYERTGDRQTAEDRRREGEAVAQLLA